jgi:uncharacterized protein YbdZ (MbtH family)
VQTGSESAWPLAGREDVDQMSGGPVSINPFDGDNGSFFVLVNDEEQHTLWPTSPMFQPAGGWFTAKRTALRLWDYIHRTELDRYTAEECAQKAGKQPGF